MGLVIRGADLHGSLKDIRIERGTITEVAASIERRAGDDAIEACGGAAIPGLHDHHIHIRAWAAARRSILVGPPAVRDLNGLAKALRSAAASGDGWLRAVGYHESVAGELDRHHLDRLVPDRPIRLQHRSGVLWVLNSLGLELVGAHEGDSPGIERGTDGLPTGRLWRMDSWLAERIRRTARHDPAAASLRTAARNAAADGSAELEQDLDSLSRNAAARGVTGWTDATPARPRSETLALVEAVETGRVLQRLHLMLPLDADHVTGAATCGPVKVMLDDPTLPPVEELSRIASSAHGRGRALAVHCVTRSQLAVAVAAFDDAAPAKGTDFRVEGDRVEHGADIPPGYLPLLAYRGLTVVTQPNFVYERGDQYLEDVDPHELPDLWRARSLVDAGIKVAAGSDAPFGSPDPWLAVRASVRRLSRSGQPIGTEEALDWKTALRLWLGRPTNPCSERTIAPGEPADVVVLDQPLPAALDGHEPVIVRATLIRGELAFQA